MFNGDEYACVQTDFVLDALIEFFHKVTAAREGRDALTYPESQTIVMDLTQSLLEIAYQALRTIPWTACAREQMPRLREEIDALDNHGYYLDYLQHQFSMTDSVDEQRASLRHTLENPTDDAPFSLKTLSVTHPELHDGYLRNLNDLVTYFTTYENEADKVIAKNVVGIGRTACLLATILMKMIDEWDLARRTAIYAGYFSLRVLVYPIFSDHLKCQVMLRPDARHSVFEYLRESRGYTEEELLHFDNYTILSVSYENEIQQTFAFALINHDVSFPFTQPNETCPMDFQYPVVHIQHVEVTPEFQRCGLGSFLVRHIKKLACQNKYDAVAIYEQKSMLATSGFWNAMGFKKSQVMDDWRDIEFKPVKPEVVSPLL
jgi:GNAT superfamily N-acetyltransferase